MRSEKVSVSLPAELAAWARKEAARRHVTLSGLVGQALQLLREETHARAAEMYARAVCLMLAEGYCRGDPEKAMTLVRRYVQKARRMMGEEDGGGE